MRNSIPVRLIVGVSVLVLSSSGVSDTTSDERIADLERVVEKMEQRLDALEGQDHASPSITKPGGPAGNSNDVRNWRQLQIGMSEQGVEAVLGVPGKVTVNEYFIRWYYNYPGGGSVTFDPRSRSVNAWSEPG